MELVRVTKENLASEHICCAISNNKDVQVSSKKAWLEARFDEGLVFLKGNVRGKCFIEYIPAEYAWSPIEAAGYMHIDCLWVSGQFKGQGYSSLLLDECIADSKRQGKYGLTVLSSKKKMGFLSDPKYLKYKGFELVDTAAPYFELWMLKFDADAPKPRFKECAKMGACDKDGFVIYYTSQCPFTAKYVPLLSAVAAAKGVKLDTVHINDTLSAQNAPCPFTTFALYHDGKLVTHEIQSEKKFEKLIETLA